MKNVNTVVVPGSNVEGNISSCNIETAHISTQVKSVFSLRETDTYRTYDTCTQETIKEYTIPGFTGFGVGSLLFLVLLVGLGFCAIAAYFENKY